MIDWDVPDHRRPTQLALTGENGPLKGRKAVQVSCFLDFPLYSLYIPFTLCKGNMKENRCFKKNSDTGGTTAFKRTVLARQSELSGPPVVWDIPIDHTIHPP